MDLTFIFGVSFELPLFVVTLNFLGIVHYAQLKKWRRGMIVGLACLAAVITPGGDPLSMTVLMMALIILQEIAIQITRIHDRRQHKPEWLSSDDDKASILDETSDVEVSSTIATASYTETNKKFN